MARIRAQTRRFIAETTRFVLLWAANHRNSANCKPITPTQGANIEQT